MYSKRNLWCGVVVVLLIGALAAYGAAAQQCGSAKMTCPKGGQCMKQGEDGWISLCDGKNLACWQNARKADAENQWFVEDGTMTNKHHANNTSTKCTFKDFELKLEYKIVKDGNSGVYLRGRIELQILDSFGHEKPGTGDDGAIYGKFVPLVNASRPAGEWNQLEATYVGDTLTAKLNGKLIHDKQKITEPTGGALPGKVNDPGPLMLQGDHGKIWFRNIMVRPLQAK